MFKMVQSNHRGYSATGKRGRSEGEQWGKKTSVMRLKQNAKTNRRGRAEKDRETERESLKKCHPPPSMFLLPLCCSCVFLTHSICSNVQIRNKQEQ